MIHSTDTNYNSCPVILIGGTGRSGTTILRKIIENHRDVATIPEWRFLSDPDGILEYLHILENSNAFTGDQAFKRLETLFSDVTSSSIFSRIFAKYFSWIDSRSPIRLTQRAYGSFSIQPVPNIKELVKSYLEALTEFKWEGQYAGMKRWQNRNNICYPTSLASAHDATINFLSKISQSAMAAQGKERFLEKNTWSLLYFSRVAKLYPTGKFVHIYRDPRDVVASFCAQPWMPNDPVKSALILRDMYAQWHKELTLVPENRYMEISLENLVSNTEETLRLLCSFWNLPFYDELLNQDLSRSNSGRWKSEIPIKLQETVNEILQESIKIYGNDDR